MTKHAVVDCRFVFIKQVVGNARAAIRSLLLVRRYQQMQNAHVTVMFGDLTLSFPLHQLRPVFSKKALPNLNPFDAVSTSSAKRGHVVSSFKFLLCCVRPLWCGVCVISSSHRHWITIQGSCMQLPKTS